MTQLLGLPLILVGVEQPRYAFSGLPWTPIRLAGASTVAPEIGPVRGLSFRECRR